MKFNRFFLPALMAAAMCSCSDDPKDDPNNDWIVNFDSVTAFTKDAYWEFCYDKEYENSLTFTNFRRVGKTSATAVTLPNMAA